MAFLLRIKARSVAVVLPMLPLLVVNGPALAQSVFIDTGQSAILAAGAVSALEGVEPGKHVMLAGSVRGKLDVSVIAGSTEGSKAAAAGVAFLLDRSRFVMGSFGVDVSIADRDVSRPFESETVVGTSVAFALQSVLGSGRWRAVPEVSATGGITFGTGEVPAVGGGIALSVQCRLSERFSVILSPEYVLAGRVMGSGAETRAGAICALGLLVIPAVGTPPDPP